MEPLRFNLCAMGVPAQSFWFRYHVSTERDLPVVTEFAARVVNVVGCMKAQELAAFFGLRDRQARELLRLLEAEGLIVRNDDSIELSSYAKARFAVSGGSSLRLEQMQEKRRVVAFDLLSYSHLKGFDGGSGQSGSALGLDLPDDGRFASTKDHAEKAFFEQFNDIERKMGGGKPALALYKVDSTEAQRRFTFPLVHQFFVESDGRIERRFDEGVELPPGLVEQVTPLVSDTLAQQSVHLAESAREFVRTFQDDLLERFVDSAGRLSLRQYLTDVHWARSRAYSGSQTRPVLGAAYLPERLKEIVACIEKTSGLTPASVKEMYWLLPDYELWGRTAALGSAVDAIRAKLTDNQQKDVAVRWVSHQSRESRRRIGQLYEAGVRGPLEVPFSEAMRRWDVLFIPGVLAYVVYWATTTDSDSLLVPLGFLTTDSLRLDVVADWVKGVVGKSQ